MTEFTPIAGQPFALAEDLALVLAPNPSPMTCLGTNTYLLGRETLAIIDPGPDDAAHLAALKMAIAGRPVSHILLTHSHLDHSPLAAPLSGLTGAPTYAFGDSAAGRSAVMARLAKAGLAGGGEGIDDAFAPDQCLRDGDTVAGSWGRVTALHTPGHIGNHLCFVWGRAVFTGDHIMGWSSSLVSPPDGDLTDFMASCDKLKNVTADIYYPGHGAPVLDPAARLAWLIAHRKTREAQILDALQAQPATAQEVTKEVYTDVSSALLGAAERNVFAHLVDLHERGKVTAEPHLSATARFGIAAR
ncbi:MBL fold metallo-hydrolase [Yoonia sp. F2084L]|uniref:MBL fold metallo-hydrolase n=1 Tax=Yoonia sp. F2084L TaxID=2926419 RepID=UPI001FF5776B|nr:MBL fold metallo-hydrolase [Yoonia sp. F2084L]MCK0094580.1 MBL fold metallo-hydrolase [Yoonia sp. F2084L]